MLKSHIERINKKKEKINLNGSSVLFITDCDCFKVSSSEQSHSSRVDIYVSIV